MKIKDLSNVLCTTNDGNLRGRGKFSQGATKAVHAHEHDNVHAHDHAKKVDRYTTLKIVELKNSALRPGAAEVLDVLLQC